MVTLRREAIKAVLLLGIAGLALLLTVGPVAAQGSVTPSFGDGKLTLVGEGYRAGERVAITVRLAGASYQFNATADRRGRFRLETGLQVPPLSKVEVESRDEQGETQVTMTNSRASSLPPQPLAGCSFNLGFKALHDLMPDIIGECLEDEYHNPDNGDGLQRTATGLLVWRKADNWTAFTDGTTTWLHGPCGLQSRSNQGPPYPWEGQATGGCS
jgi:hypothetical protein